MHRDSTKLLLVRAVRAVVHVAPFLVVWESARQRFDTLPDLLWPVLLVLYAGGTLYSVVVGWLTTRYRITPDKIHFARGLLVRTTTSVRWAEVASVQVSRPLAQQLLRCSSVRVATGSRSSGDVVLEAASAEVVEEIRTRAAEARPGAVRPRAGDTPPPAAPGGRPGTPAPTALGDVVHRMRLRDHLLVSVTYGQFVLVVPACLAAYVELSAWVDLPRPGALPDLRPSGIAGLLLGGLVVVAVALAFGYVVTYVRYREFAVHAAGNRLRVSGGLLTRESRQVMRSEVIGLKVQQNPVMRLLGHGRLSYISRESGERLAGNVIFPVVPLHRLAAGVAEYFPGHEAVARPPRRPVGAVESVAALLGVVVLGLLSAGVSGLRPSASPVTVAASAVVGLLVANLLWTAAVFDEDGHRIVVRRGFLWVTTYSLLVPGVHVASYRQGPVGRFLGVAALSLLVHDGRAVRIRLAAGLDPVATAVRDAVRGSPAGPSPTRHRVPPAPSSGGR